MNRVQNVFSASVVLLLTATSVMAEHGRYLYIQTNDIREGSERGARLLANG